MFVGELAARRRPPPPDARRRRLGDPFEREPEAVAEDVLDEKVSVAAARELYGVVVAHDGSVDAAATDDLRRAKVPT